MARKSGLTAPSVPGPPLALRVFAPPVAPEERARPSSDTASDRIPRLIAYSPAMLALVAKARQVARSKVAVLIQGESGTGKELLAQLIHDASPRREMDFIQVNCASFSESLVESELFGHEKGAFTGAEQRHRGLFERAAGGSLLLDEIGEMPLRLQAKLLRVLEGETFDRVGGEQTVKVDVRFIATTNRDLDGEVAQGDFRRDLFYRLNAMPLHIPALRTRTEDIPPLVHYFIDCYGAQGMVPITAIAPDALALLCAYSWPGNVRQLRNVIHHACVLAESELIEVRDLPPLLEPAAASISRGVQQTLSQIERQVILETLREVGGNKTAAALRLGVTARTLQNKLKKYRSN